MDKSLMVFILIGGLFFYFVMDLVKDTNAADGYATTTVEENPYAKYQTEDSIGEKILDVSLADPVTQLKAWQASDIRKEFLDLFPDFDTMHGFVKNRVRGEPLVQKLNKTIKEVEDKFYSGTLTAEEAKRVLANLK